MSRGAHRWRARANKNVARRLSKFSNLPGANRTAALRADKDEGTAAVVRQRQTNVRTLCPRVTSFPLARQNGRTIDRASTDEHFSPSQTSANNVRKQCPRRQNGRLERAGRLRTGHRRFRRHTVSETGSFPPYTDGQGCEGLFSHLPAVHRCCCCVAA